MMTDLTKSTLHNSTKINKLLRDWPTDGFVATQVWLDERGISRQLARSYCKYQWLKSLGNGAYMRYSDQLSGKNAIYTLQNVLGLKVHVAADAALKSEGVWHYVTFDETYIGWMFVDSTETKNIPRWFYDLFVKTNDAKIRHTNLFSSKWDIGMAANNVGKVRVMFSSPERAIMECLYLAPQELSLEYASLLMEKLRTLRPELCEELLIHCSSVKVKRLFLYLAELHNHNWVKLINKNQIDLGSGTRQITKNGHYVAEYKLVLPDLRRHEGYDD